MMQGILNVYKEQGYTSHDVVAKLRGILHQKKIGHTGTLDPAAAGVLPVCLGTATKLCEFLADHDKEYRAVLLLGVTTDTQDTTGKILSCAAGEVPELFFQEAAEDLTLAGNGPCAADAPSDGENRLERALAESGRLPQEKRIRDVMESFVGEYDQIPPMYSARKVGGKKLYELAREGKTVERKAARVEIFRIRIEKIRLPRVTFTVHCSKGTYIRTLCHDIGEALGCGGCMAELLRTRVGEFALEDALKLGEIEALAAAGGLEEHILPVDAVFAGLLPVHTRPDTDRLLYNGNPLTAGQLEGDAAELASRNEAGGSPLEARVRVYDSAGRFCGLYAYVPEKERYQPEKMFLA